MRICEKISGISVIGLAVKSLVTVVFLVFTFSLVHAQTNIDSLKRVWNNTKLADTIRLKAINDFAWDGYLFSQPDSACYFAQLQYDYAKKKKLKVYMAAALKVQGTSYYVRGEFEKALTYYQKAIQYFKEVGSERGVAGTENNMGLIHKEMGNYKKAIHFFMKSLKYDEKINDLDGIATSLNNIGTIYIDHAEYDKGMDYFKRSYAIHIKNKNYDGAALCLNNIGSVYINLDQFQKSISYNRKSLEMRLKLNGKNSLAQSYLNLGVAYHKLKRFDSSEFCIKKANQLYTEFDDKRGISATEYYFGEMQLEKGNIALAKKHLLKAFDLSTSVGDAIEYSYILADLKKVYLLEGNYKKALEMYEELVREQDSLKSESNQKELIRQEYKYKYEKQATADSVANAKEHEIKNAEIAKQKAELKAKRNQQFLSYGGLALVLVFAGFMYNRFKVTSRQKREIEEQKLLLEEKQKEILDSIRYAKRIQIAQLPTEKRIDKIIKQLRKS